MGILGDMGDKMSVQSSLDNADSQKEAEKALNQMYGYNEQDEEKKNQMLLQFLQYLKESKARDQARLQQSRIV